MLEKCARFGNRTVAAVCLALLTGCFGEKSGIEPKDRLNSYITATFSVKSLDDRTRLMDFLTTRAKTRLAAWTDDQFEQAFIETKRDFLKLVFRDVKAVSTAEVSITYELSYLDKSKTSESKVTNLKAASMVQEGGKWFIAEIRNIKELIEYKNEMSFP